MAVAATWLADRGFGRPAPAPPLKAEDERVSLEALRAVLSASSEPGKRSPHQSREWRYKVEVSDAADPSRVQSLPDAKFPGIGGCGIEVGDFNFDGFTDFALPRDFVDGHGLAGPKNRRAEW